jgi:hypothetical protein
MSLARLHHRKDVTYRKVSDVPGPEIGLIWRKDADSELHQELAGIVRGRTSRSTRGLGKLDPKQPPPKKPATPRKRNPPRLQRGARR